jgi:hypothetical protein
VPNAPSTCTADNKNSAPRWAEWEAGRANAQANGREVPSLFEDETHLALVSEMKAILGDLQTDLAVPHLEPATATQLRQRLSPEQKATFRQELMQQLQASPPDVQAHTASIIEKSLRQFAAEHGPTSGFQAVVDKLDAQKTQAQSSDESGEPTEGGGA